MRQAAEQPSPSVVFASSQSSPTFRVPSPQAAMHAPVGIPAGREKPSAHSHVCGAPAWLMQTSFVPQTAPAQSFTSMQNWPLPWYPVLHWHE